MTNSYPDYTDLLSSGFTDEDATDFRTALANYITNTVDDVTLSAADLAQLNATRLNAWFASRLNAAKADKQWKDRVVGVLESTFTGLNAQLNTITTGATDPQLRDILVTFYRKLIIDVFDIMSAAGIDNNVNMPTFHPDHTATSES